MAHTLRPSKKISYNENEIDPSEYLTDIKKEPVDNHDEQESFGVKNEHFEYQNGSNFDTNDPYPASSNAWELIVKRCRYLIQEEHEHYQMNSHLLTKILVKEVNEILSNVVAFFQDCCISVEQNENYIENVLEVDGLLVNCLPCHPQNNSCYYKISNDIPQFYLETLFCPLESEIENNYYNGEDYLPLAPEVDINIKKVDVNIKKETTDVKIKKKKKKSTKTGPRKVCEQCGKDFKTNTSLREHVTSRHENKRLYKCNKCGDSYRSRAGLFIHKRREGDNKCPGKPRNSRKIIFFGASTGADPKCVHPDCADKNLPRFTYAGIMKHVIEFHSPDPDDSVSLSSKFNHGLKSINTIAKENIGTLTT